MATIDLATRLNAGLHQANSGNVKTPYLYEVTLDFADAVTLKGSALATNDIIEIIDVPAQTMILAAGWQKETALTGTVSVLTADLGVTGVDVDRFVDGDDLFASAVGDYTQHAAAYWPLTIGTTADTIDLVMLTQTGTVTGGTIRVFALLVDLADAIKPGITALRS